MMPAMHEFALALGSSLPASIVAKATVVVALGSIGARLTRRQRAAVRHVLLAATFGVLLLLPVVSIVVPPVRIPVRTVAQNHAAPSPSVAIDTFAPVKLPDTHEAVAPVVSRSPGLSLLALVLAGWLAGVGLFLSPVILGFWKIRCQRRSGLPWAAGHAAVDRLALETGIRRRVDLLLHEALPGPIASGVLHPAILLPPDAETWEREDLNRALVHELEHVRRGDVMIHCVARAVCAAYWFHPLVWMAWRQLVLEAERACDDAVIARSEATAYADQLVALARRLFTTSKSPLLAMANRSDLVIRVKAVLDSRQPRGRAGTLAVVLGCAAAVALVLTISPLRTVSAPQSASAQGAAPTVAPSAPLPSFEVASIKPNRSGDTIGGALMPPERYTATNLPIKGLIEFAYNVQDFQLSGGPSWITSERYDVDAKVDDSRAGELRKLSFWRRRDQMRLMVQSLLTDRFSLLLSHKTEILPIYALVIAKTGAKLQESKPNKNDSSGAKGHVGQEGEFSISQGQLTAQRFSIEGLVWLLSRPLGRPVVDRTGLKGNYDFTLQWSPDEGHGAMAKVQTDDGPGTAAAPLPGSSGPSIFTAIQEQLGLKLESTKGPLDVIVIDYIERPSEN